MDFTGRLNEHVPELVFCIEFAQQKYFYPCTGLLLVAVEACGKYLGVIEYKKVAVIEIVDYLLENTVFYFAGSAVEHHQA